jgi:uncharacterized protein
MNKADEIAQAVSRRDMAALRTLTPADANMRDQDGFTPLMHAVLAEDADPALVRLLIDRGAHVNAAESRQGYTALHFAARDQNTALVRTLLGAGAEPDPLDVFGDTPLWRSVMTSSGDLATIKLLIEHGADPNVRNRSGISPLSLARDTGQDDVVKLLQDRGRPSP